jgi:hypothetical protein
MLISIIGKLLPVLKHFIAAVKDKHLDPDEAEALALEAALVIAAILKEVAPKK